MRDENDRDVVFLQPADQLVKPRALEWAERRGRLVHDDHVMLGVDGTHDLQHLLIGNRKRIGFSVRRDFHAHPLGQFAKALLHAGAVDDEPALRDFAQKDIGQRRHLRDDCQFLIDRRNAVVALRPWILE
jgi:hypothetical protein